tara:strand:- start:1085 stop:1387 length:303 start_codon:yes stop_codon:yes gene_type:complete
MSFDYWLSKEKMETPQEEVDLIFETTDFTLAEAGELPQTGKEYENFEIARLRTEILVSIMEQKTTSLNSKSIARIKKISDGLEKAYKLARSEASQKTMQI